MNEDTDAVAPLAHEVLVAPTGRRLAYRHVPARQTGGPGVVFLGGLMSDMSGTKAAHLEAWARRTGRAFTRFDYSGHGLSSGRFTDGTIGDWAEDARAILEGVATGPQVLVGSSMGGWIALLLARDLPRRVAGLVTIAAAPDFTEDSIWPNLTESQRAELEAGGVTHLPSDYGAPYPITRRLLEDGRRHLVLRSALRLECPVRLLQGTADRDVEMSVALRLLEHADGPDIRLTLVKGADHRFSTPDCLTLIEAATEEVLARAGATGAEG